jgi:protein involved in temperature-dependent protein secretion
MLHHTSDTHSCPQNLVGNHIMMSPFVASSSIARASNIQRRMSVRARGFRAASDNIAPLGRTNSIANPFLPRPTDYEEPDTTLITALYDAIDESPPALDARKLLIQHFMACGYLDTAREQVQELMDLDPSDEDAQTWYVMLVSAGEFHQQEEKREGSPQRPKPQRIVVEKENVDRARTELRDGYEALSKNASMLGWEMTALRDLLQLKWKGKSKARVHDFESKISAVEDLARGKVNSVKPSQSSTAPTSARTVARAMEAAYDPDKAMDIALEDLMAIAKWLQSVENQATRLTLSTNSAEPNDSVRESLVKRVQALKAALPQQLQPSADTAFMHVEHEVLKKNYQGITKTMNLDDVADIPRENFWVSEDGYPWDMEELAAAIKANSGVFRNPLSKTMFTPADVQAIIKHPYGRSLAALQVQQSQLRKGVRPQTIEMMEKLSTTLLEDQSEDQLASRHIVDEFLAYVATLPEVEQEAINGLKVPAKDSHTGQAFDCTIGDAIRDAQGNRVCIHKTGDFIGQSAKFLRQNR